MRRPLASPLRSPAAATGPSRGGTRSRRSVCCSSTATPSRSTASATAPAGRASASARRPPRISSQNRHGLGVDSRRRRWPARPAGQAAVGDVERHEPGNRAAVDAALDVRRHSFDLRHAPQERADAERRRVGHQRLQPAQQPGVEIGRRRPLEGQTVDGLQHRHGPAEEHQVLPQSGELLHVPRAVRTGDGVELSPSPPQGDVDETRRLQTRPEAAAGAANALRHTADLSVLPPQQHDDAVRLGEAVRPQHHRPIPVRARPVGRAHRCAYRGPGPGAAHLSSPPKRRSRRWYSATASNRWVRPKSGQSTSRNTISL